MKQRALTRAGRRKTRAVPVGANNLTNKTLARVCFDGTGAAKEWRCANVGCPQPLAERTGAKLELRDYFVWSKKAGCYLVPKENKSHKFWPSIYNRSDFKQRFENDPAFRRAFHQSHAQRADEQLPDFPKVEISALPFAVICSHCGVRSILTNARPSSRHNRIEPQAPSEEAL